MATHRNAHPLEILIVDATETTNRIKRDVRHLKEIGKRGALALRMIEAKARQSATAGLERVADVIIAFEERLGRRE